MPTTLEDVEKLLKEKSGFWDKFNHPFFGSFLTSWIICNWDLLYILLTGFDNPYQTIFQIKKEFSPIDDFWFTGVTNLIHLLFIPLLGMGGYVYFGPRLLNWYLLHKHKQMVKRTFNEDVASGLEPVTKKQHEELIVRNNELQMKLNIADSAYRYASELSKKVRIPSPGNAGHDMDLKDLIAQYTEYEKDDQRRRVEVARLKADLVSRGVEGRNAEKA